MVPFCPPNILKTARIVKKNVGFSKEHKQIIIKAVNVSGVVLFRNE
jgi:hypothetical protein